MYILSIGIIISAISVSNSRPCGDDESWLEYGDKCLKHYSNALPWSTADTTCSYFQEAQLATVDSQEMNMFVHNNLTRGSDVWIGLKIPGISKPNWEWSDGGRTSLYDNWKNADVNSACAVMANGDQNRNWYTEPCTNMKPFICEKEMGGDNCSDLLSFDTHCYLIIEEPKETNMAAARYCYQYDAYLISINSEKEAEFIDSNLNRNKEYWIGLSPLKWVNDEPYQWNNWGDSGPMDNVTESCVYMDSTSGRWFSGHCNQAFIKAHSYICEKDAYFDFIAASNVAIGVTTSITTLLDESFIDGLNISTTPSSTDNSEQLLLTVVVPAVCGGIIAIIVIIVVVIVIRRRRRSNRSKKASPSQMNTPFDITPTAANGNDKGENSTDINSQSQEKYIYDEAEIVQADNGTVVVNGDVYAIVDKDKIQNPKVQDNMVSQQHTKNNRKQEIAKGQNHIIIGSDVYAIVNKNSVTADSQQKPKQKKKKPPTPPKLENNSGEINSNGLSHVVVGTDVYAVVDKDKVKPNKQQTTQQKKKKPPTPPELEDKTEDLNTNGQSHILVGTDVYAVVDKEKVKPNKHQKPQQRKKKPPAPPKLVEKADVMHEGSVYYESDINAIPATPTKHKTEVKKKTEDTGVVYADLDLTGSGTSSHQAGNHYEESGVVYADVRG